MCKTTERAEFLLPFDSTSPGTARELARASHCTDHALDVLDEAVLLISELVTNSVLYGKPPVLLEILCQEDGLRVSVRDGTSVVPRQRHPSTSSESGRGLQLVDLLSAAWGIEPVQDEHGSGKSVWFELHPPA